MTKLRLNALVIVLFMNSSTAHNSTCPPWFIRDGDKCKCGSSLGGVISCTNDPTADVSIKTCYCMTVDEDTNEAVVGACPYACIADAQWSNDSSELNYHMCNETWKRTGQLCSQCITDHGPLVYSYSMQCVPCSSDVVRHSLLLFLASFLPLTVFCIAIITLRISGARPPMNTFLSGDVSTTVHVPHVYSNFISHIYTFLCNTDCT